MDVYSNSIHHCQEMEMESPQMPFNGQMDNQLWDSSTTGDS